MKEFLSISEAAKLSDTSTHQLRYFEEKGILQPDRKDGSEYRLYSEDDMYKLAQILFLRKFDIPVSKIRESFDSYERDEYVGLIEDKVSEIEEKIRELTELRDFTKGLLNKLEESESNLERFITKTIAERSILEKAKLKYKNEYSIEDFYSDFKDVDGLYEKDIIYLMDREGYSLCIEEKKGKKYKEHILQEGEYLIYTFTAGNDGDIEKEIFRFFSHARKNKIKLQGKLVVVENSSLSLVENQKNYYEIQGKIKK